jgi:hypothetical protein
MSHYLAPESLADKTQPLRVMAGTGPEFGSPARNAGIPAFRPSTTFFELQGPQVVDARAKRGHDELNIRHHCRTNWT